jgi:hypothetical protein
MICWPCTSIYPCNETNSMHYLPSVYSVTIPLHVSGLLVPHHQELKIYICDNWCVLFVLVDCQRFGTRLADSQLKRTTHTKCFIYILLTPDDGQLASPKHGEVQWLNKLKINSASSLFHCTLTYVILNTLFVYKTFLFSNTFYFLSNLILNWVINSVVIYPRFYYSSYCATSLLIPPPSGWPRTWKLPGRYESHGAVQNGRAAAHSTLSNTGTPCARRLLQTT